MESVSFYLISLELNYILFSEHKFLYL